MGMSFFRDRKGLEVDLLIETARGPIAVEIKSGQTIAEDFFTPIRQVVSEFGRARGKPAQSFVVYAGDTEQRRSDCTVLPWSAVNDLAAW